MTLEREVLDCIYGIVGELIGIVDAWTVEIAENGCDPGLLRRVKASLIEANYTLQALRSRAVFPWHEDRS